MRLRNLLRLMLRLEVCLHQAKAKGLCSGSDIIFLSTLLRLGLGNKSQARPLVKQKERENVTNFFYVKHRMYRATNLHKPRKFNMNAVCDVLEI